MTIEKSLPNMVMVCVDGVEMETSMDDTFTGIKSG